MEKLFTVRPIKTASQKILEILFLVLTVLFALGFLLLQALPLIPTICLLLALASGLTYWYGFKTRIIDYDYQYIDGEFSFVRITNMSRRKVLCKVDMNEVAMIAPTGDDSIAQFASSGMYTRKDYSTHQEGAKTVELYAPSNGKNLCIIFEPDNDFLDHIWRQFPRKVVKFPQY